MIVYCIQFNGISLVPLWVVSVFLRDLSCSASFVCGLRVS